MDDTRELSVSPSAIEVAELLSAAAHILTPAGRLILRRLAFDRDRLAADLRHAEAENAELAAERERTANLLVAEEELSKQLAASLKAIRADLSARADRQEAFAGPEYTQHTEIQRGWFRHTAKQLRAALLAARSTPATKEAP